MQNKINELRSDYQLFAIATIVKTEGSVPREIGAKMLVYKEKNDFSFLGTVGGGGLESQVIEDAKVLLTKKRSELKEYDLSAVDQVCGGKAQVFIEIEKPSIPLYLFGAGHVGQALCRVLTDTPFEIHLVDEREEWTNKNKDIKSYCMAWNDFCKQATWNSPFVIIMTHDHKFDNEILECVLGKEAQYIGLMGSSTKWHKFKKELSDKNFAVSLLDQVRCPIGNKKVGRSPAEIAIGIANEILLELSEG